MKLDFSRIAREKLILQIRVRLYRILFLQITELVANDIPVLCALGCSYDNWNRLPEVYIKSCYDLSQLLYDVLSH